MKRLLASLLVLAGTAGVACYQDDALTHVPAIAPTKVFITDAPFPFDTVGSVNIYVTKIEACACLDSLTQTGGWVTIAAPNKSFDLLALQQGTTAFVGQATIDAGKYAEIRMTIDADQSSIKYLDGSSANVIWPSSGLVQLYAAIEDPLAVSATGAEIVIDFDVGRSFLYDFSGQKDFLMQPSLRAVNIAATGSVAGTVTGPDQNPIKNANISVYSGNPSFPRSAANVWATGRTDSQGHYQVSFLEAGTWIVQAEQPDKPGLAAAVAPSVQVAAGNTTTLNLQLSHVAQGTYIHITGPSSIGFGGTAELLAAVGDSNGYPQANPQVTWTSRNPAVAAVLLDSSSVGDSASIILVLGTAVGSTWIVASSGTLKDSISIQVTPGTPLVPVATITLVPSSLTLAVGDTGVFDVELRDSVGNLLTNRQVSWFFTDSTGVATLYLATGAEGGVHAIHTGTTVLRAASEGKFKDGTITVH